MTPTEAAELQELGLTPEQLKAKQQALASVTAPQPNGRKRRSDAGKPREIKTGPLEVTIRLPLEDARQLPFACSATERVRLAFEIQDQILAQLQKQLARTRGQALSVREE